MTEAVRKRPRLFFLTVIAAAGPLAMNILNPAMPIIETDFQTSYEVAGLTLTLYLLALGVSQLFVGSLSDRFGRRPIVLIGMLLFILGSLFCYMATSIEFLIFGRIIQAAGGCTGLVMGRTMVRDMYGTEKAASMLAYMVMIMVVVPLIATPLGGFLTDRSGWQANMILAGIYGIFAFALSVKWLHETHFNLQPMTGLFQMFSGFGSLIVNPRFTHNAFQTAFSSAAFFAFVAGAPKAMQDMGESPTTFGLYFAVAGFFYMAGNFITGRKSESWGPSRLVLFGTLSAFSGGLHLLACLLTGTLTPITLFTGMAIVAFGNGLSLPSGTAGAVSADLNRIGAAAGLSGFLQIGGGALASALVAKLMALTGGPDPLIYAMTLSVTVALAISLAGQSYEKRLATRASA
ncbi:multidrug effflux MFS transporter [Aestuariispira insulae]|uniref:Bcr/CflA family efflux transporter n=1 Tax=Aestuariispira insulae TaxID=1461337 RepID=A0A3D9HV69_9PROT|nr:multidrug effflux MFS transporter [Aestuariispira insulae]RED53357.1 DHA1 family bicyclomycin/chloramphenicol resistance-like MFS transporter [Aestuariispira insulae]